MTSYTSDSIQTLQFPESVRVSPGVYIGAVDADGYWLILRECLDNGLDEYLAGRNKGVALVEDKDGSFWIYDQGAGIPQGAKEWYVNLGAKKIRSIMPTMQAVFSELHTSGKYRSDAYRTSVGSHGLGAKASNALSEYFNVATCYKNKWYSVGFRRGALSSPVKPCIAPIFLGKKLNKGTLIHLKHDKLIFKNDNGLDFSKAKSWAEITSYLNPGFTVIIKDKAGNTYKYCSKDGAKEYVKKLLEELKAQAEPINFEFKNELADVIVSFSNAEGCNVRGYTNGLFNSDGGKHVDSVSTSLFNACRQYAKARQSVSFYDFKEGLVGIVNMHLHKAEFSSQDKLKLTDNRAGADFEKVLEAAAVSFFKKNKALAVKLCEKASKLSELRSQFKASKKMISAINSAKKKGMPVKYSPYDSKSKLEDRELLIVEGLSAAGGLRKVRNSYQAIYPIKGKIFNLAKNTAKGLESEEIINILSAIGYDPKAEDPISKLQVGRVICLADADDDGPLAPNTKVLLCNGTTKTIGELAAAWNKDHKPFWIWALDSNGQLHAAQAVDPRITCYKDKYAIVEFDDGTKIKCTLNHKFAVNYSTSQEHIVDTSTGIHYLAAKHLKPGDSIMSAYFKDEKIAWNGTAKYKHFIQPNGKLRALHSIVAEDAYPDQYASYKKANIQAKAQKSMKLLQNIHHKDSNKLNNDPSNLEFINAINHWKYHGKQWCDSYNSSKKHKQDLANFFSSDKGKQFIKKSTERRIQYNKSEKNRKGTADLNKREDVKYLQIMGKFARKYLAIKALEKEVTIENWPKYDVSAAISSFVSNEFLEKIDNFIKYEATKQLEPYALKQSDDISCKINRIKKYLHATINYCKKLLAAGFSITQDSYNSQCAQIIKSSWRPINWYTLIGYFEYINAITSEAEIDDYIKSLINNHKVVKVTFKKAKEPKPFYCLTVPKYGNFLLADKNGNGICSSNCHINTLLLTLFYKVLPQMFEKNMIYVADMPEFYAEYKRQVATGDSVSEVRKKLDDMHAPKSVEINHIKGWGEINDQLMKALACDKASRRLVKIKAITHEDDVTFIRIMNEDVAYRRHMLGLSDNV